MTWNYRVVRTLQGDEASFAIHETYYDADGRPDAISETPDAAHGETLDELRADLARQMAALSKPVLDGDTMEE